MIRLHLLGSVRLLDGDSQDIRAVLQQPKRLALLAFLAAARPRGAHRRDTLTGMFWGESDDVSARRSLSQGIYFLRQKIHPDLFAGRFAEEVELQRSEIWCDVVEFEEALDDGRTAEALALYTGELMPGFHISDAPEWEKWLDTERDRLRNRAAEAAWALAGSEEQAGHAGAAAHWARWAAALHPFDEQQHRRVLELLVRTGDRAGALRAHEEFARRLTTEFEVEPSPETAALVEAIRRDAGTGEQDALIERAAQGLVRRPDVVRSTGTRPAGDGDDAAAHAVGVASGVPASADFVSEATPTRAVFRAPSPRRRLRQLTSARGIALIGIVIAIISGIYLAGRPGNGSPGTVAVAPEQPLNRIAILPFRDLSEGGRLSHVAEGLALALTDRLAEVSQLSIISPNTTSQFASATHDSIGRALNTGVVVEGSVEQSASRLRVRVELIDARLGTTLGISRLEQEQGDLFLLLDSMATSVGLMLREKLGQEIVLREFRQETESERAWESLQIARESHSAAQTLDGVAAEEAIVRALASIDAAIDEDPTYVKAVVERSRIFQTATLNKLSTPPAASALLDSAEAAAEHAVAIGSADAAALEQRAHIRYFEWLLRPQEGNDDLLAQAEADARQALAADPDHVRAESLLSQILYQRGEFQQAYQAALRAYYADAWAERFEDVLLRLFETSFELGNDDEAAKWCDELRRRQPASWLQYQCELTLLAFGTTGSPDVRKSLRSLDAARRLPRVQAHGDIEAQLTALVGASYARAGLQDSARVYVDRAMTAAPANPYVLAFNAATMLRLGDEERCGELLRTYLTALPGHKQRLLRSRLLAPLDQQARSQMLVATGTRLRR